MMSKAPFRKVIGFDTEERWTPTGGNSTKEWEVLECGHRFAPKFNALLGGTDLMDHKRRRCHECAAIAKAEGQ